MPGARVVPGEETIPAVAAALRDPSTEGSMKILAVLNICGISGRQNVSYYVDTIRSLLLQTHGVKEPQNLKVAISSCASLPECRLSLERAFGDYVTYNWIPGRYPLGVTFNDTVDQCVKHFGAFDGYLYIDSGVSLWGQWGMVEFMAQWHQETKNAAISAVATSNDTGFEWWGIPMEPGVYTLPVGKAFNMHFQLFDEEWRKAYGRILPDLFASDTSESVFTFMAAGIKRKVQIHRSLSVLHAHSMDGASSGFRGKIIFPGVPGQKTMDQIYEEGKGLGFGYEECSPDKKWVHDPGKFTADTGEAIDPVALRDFIKENLYVHPPVFDYQHIHREFVPGQ